MTFRIFVFEPLSGRANLKLINKKGL
jgi:hypothetical protein